MTEIRALTADEYPRLKDVADGFTPDPNSSIVLVAEENGEVVGRMTLISLIHIEGTWVREDKRGGMTAARLMHRAIAEAKKLGLSWLMAFTADAQPRVGEMVQRAGFDQLPIKVWARRIQCQ